MRSHDRRRLDLVTSDRPGRRNVVTTTLSDKETRPLSDLADRNFTVSQLNQLGVADITLVPTARVLLYLTVVLDGWRRKVVGRSKANYLRADLLIKALETAGQATQARRSNPPQRSVQPRRIQVIVATPVFVGLAAG